MQTEYVYLSLGDRASPKEWNESGRPHLVQKAIARKRQILETVFSRHVPDEVDRAIRERFAIHLPGRTPTR